MPLGDSLRHATRPMTNDCGTWDQGGWRRDNMDTKYTTLTGIITLVDHLGDWTRKKSQPSSLQPCELYTVSHNMLR